jgi:hypothetical protein
MTQRFLVLGSVTLLASTARTVVMAGGVSSALPTIISATRSGGATGGERHVS